MVTFGQKINLARMQFGREPLDEIVDADEELTPEDEMDMDRVIRELHERLEQGLDIDPNLWYTVEDK